MGYAVIRMEKCKQNDLRGMQYHNNRERKSHTNLDIDYEKSKNNKHLVPCDNYTQKINEILTGKLNRKIRKDAVLMCNFIITSDKYTMESIDYMEYFKESVDFLKRKYGAKNLVFATVHLDETTPHLHVGIVPLVSDERGYRLSSKELFNKHTLRNLHTEFHEQVGKNFNLQRGVEGSPAKHLTTLEYKKQQLEQTNDELIKNIQALKERPIVKKYKLVKEDKGILGYLTNNVPLQKHNELIQKLNQSLEKNAELEKKQKVLVGNLEKAKAEIEQFKPVKELILNLRDENSQLKQKNKSLLSENLRLNALVRSLEGTVKKIREIILERSESILDPLKSILGIETQKEKKERENFERMLESLEKTKQEKMKSKLSRSDDFEL